MSARSNDPLRSEQADDTPGDEPIKGTMVRRIFDMAASGMSPRDIAQALNAEGPATTAGGGQ